MQPKKRTLYCTWYDLQCWKDLKCCRNAIDQVDVSPLSSRWWIRRSGWRARSRPAWACRTCWWGWRGGRTSSAGCRWSWGPRADPCAAGRPRPPAAMPLSSVSAKSSLLLLMALLSTLLVRTPWGGFQGDWNKPETHILRKHSDLEPRRGGGGYAQMGIAALFLIVSLLRRELTSVPPTPIGVKWSNIPQAPMT